MTLELIIQMVMKLIPPLNLILDPNSGTGIQYNANVGGGLTVTNSVSSFWCIHS